MSISAMSLRPGAVRASPIAARSLDLAQLQERLLLALLPCLLLGLYHTGRQANLASLGREGAAGPDWYRAAFDAFGAGYDPADMIACALRGFLIVLPLAAVALATAEIWRHVFGRSGRAEASGFAATALLFSLALPPTLPLWQVAVGLSFGIVIGKEIFGGTGMNFLNPALVGVAFLYFTYPDSMREPDLGNALPPMVLASSAGLAGIQEAGIGWLDAFRGDVAGPIGATSTLGCLLGAVVLLQTRYVSWRVLAGGVLGMVVAASVFAGVAPTGLPVATLPWYWHLNVGGFAFALVFLAGDPVTAATTNPGRWIYGAFIGGMTVLIRVANPAQTEGALLAVLLGSIVAPLIDYGFVRANIQRRRRRCV